MTKEEYLLKRCCEKSKFVFNPKKIFSDPDWIRRYSEWTNDERCCYVLHLARRVSSRPKENADYLDRLYRAMCKDTPRLEQRSETYWTVFELDFREGSLA